MSRLVVVIPAYNEEKALGKVLRDVRKVISNIGDCLVIVVDDGSQDSTIEVAINSGADVILSHPRNLGVAAAYKTALDAAIKYGADAICCIDADGQFNPYELPKLLEPLNEGNVDLIIGSRFLSQENAKNVPLMNMITNRLMAFMMSLIIGHRIRDVESGYRIISRRAAQRLELIGEVSFSHDMLLDISFKGFHFLEVPVSVRYFRYRQSRVIGGFIQYGLRAFYSIVRKLFVLIGISKSPTKEWPLAKLIFESKTSKTLRLGVRF